jgi:hypothetical protein
MQLTSFTTLQQNPSFLKRPSELLKGAYLQTKQIYFAASVISDCGANSKRDEYIQAMIDYLGPDVIHRYGKCGTKKLPGTRLKDATKHLAQYKL